MKNMTHFLFGLAIFSSVAASAQEQEVAQEQATTQDPIETQSIQTNSWTFGVGLANIDSEKAFNECIDSSATALQFGYEGQDGHFVYHVGFSGYLFGDNCKFSQRVVDGFGRESTASSSASGYGLYGEIGYSFPITPKSAHFDITAGLEKTWASRGIGNCSNCSSENIDIDSGLYIRPRFKFFNENGFTFSIGYQYFPGADIENGVILTFGMTRDTF